MSKQILRLAAVSSKGLYLLECERNDVKDKLTRASAAGARRADDK